MKRTLNCLSKKLLITIVAFLSLGVSAFAQNVSISGTVIDSDGLTLPGVNVVEKGTTNGTTTDFDGKYLINVPADGTLIFSFIGFENQEFLVNGKNVIDVKLSESSIGLNEVIAVGYGVRKKSSITGSISSIGKKELTKVPATNTASMLAGRLPRAIITNPGMYEILHITTGTATDQWDREFAPHHYYFPITLERVQNNPSLVENPGY